MPEATQLDSNKTVRQLGTSRSLKSAVILPGVHHPSHEWPHACPSQQKRPIVLNPMLPPPLEGRHLSEALSCEHLQTPDIAASREILEIVCEEMFLERNPFGYRAGLYLNITTKTTTRRLPAPLLNGIVLNRSK